LAARTREVSGKFRLANRTFSILFSTFSDFPCLCTILQDTSEIQRLVIARAVSGVHIK
jgi:hypothetical protein